ncbi:MAG: ArsR/SmtB family transcription factor [Janthinobacterium lividum]
MRPLYHPAVEDITLQGILHALADPVRVSILMGLLNADTSRSCNTFVNVKDTPLPKSTLSKHFAILREAGLIRSERKGVELQNRTRLQELVPRFGTLLEAIALIYQQEQEKEASQADR